MARASAAVAARTAQGILDSAAALFGSRGFADVSLEDVAATAGVTRGAVYHHFANKAGLFRAVAAQLQADVGKAILAAAGHVGPEPQAELSAGCHAFLEAITAAPTVRVLLIDAPSVIGWAQWRELDAENSEVLLREALARVGVAEDLVDAMTAQLSGAMNEAALWIARHSGSAEAREKAHRALDQLLASVLS